MRPGISPARSRLRQAGRSAVGGSSPPHDDFSAEPKSNAVLAEACYDNLLASRRALRIARGRSQVPSGRAGAQSALRTSRGQALTATASAASAYKATPVYARAVKSLEEAAMQTSLACMRSQCWDRDEGAHGKIGPRGVLEDRAFVALEEPTAPWQCPFCTRQNAATSLNCITCGKAYRRKRPNESTQHARHEPWRCTTCGNQNTAGTEICAVCQVGWRSHAVKERSHRSRPQQ